MHNILSQQTMEVNTLQKLAGKCISLLLAVLGAHLFTNEINCASSPKAYAGPDLLLYLVH